MILLLVFLAVTGVGISSTVAKEGTDCTKYTEKESKIIQSGRGLCVISTINKSSYNLAITAYTKKSINIDNTGILVSVDGQRAVDYSFDLAGNEQWIKNINLSTYMDVNRNSHTVTISTYGNHTKINITKRIESSNTDIPHPYITNVIVTEGTVDGKPSSVAYVTVVNPSIQLYSSKLMVHTQKTSGSFYAASVPPGESRTIKVELRDDLNGKIAGEARLYTKNVSEREGALDQVEFVGRVNGTTSLWNESYEPIRGPWRENSYKYENESYSKSYGERISGGHEIEGVPLIYPAVGIIAALLVVRRLR